MAVFDPLGKVIVNFPVRPPRTVKLSLKQEAFRPGTTELRPEWKSELGRLVKLLSQEPAVLQIVYEDRVGKQPVAQNRVNFVKEKVTQLWTEQKAGWRLIVESRIQKKAEQSAE